MHFVVSVCVTMALVWLAVFVAVSGLQKSADAAATMQSNQSHEYRAHYCGSLRAAIANLESARDLLQTVDAEKAKDYGIASAFYLAMLEENLDSDKFSCNDLATDLHTQSLGETPFNLPNHIYRLSSMEDNND